MIGRGFRGKVIMITGASNNMGRELATRLAEQGACLALGGPKYEDLELLAAECIRRGARVLIVPVDAGDKEQCQNFVEKTAQHYQQRIDILIHNASINMMERFDTTRDVSSYEKIMQVNYLGSVYCTHFALPYLKRSRGQIVGIVGMEGKSGLPIQSGYAASIHAMIGFFDSLRSELLACRIKITLAYPGSIMEHDVKNVDYYAENAMLSSSTGIILEAVKRRKREVRVVRRSKVGRILQRLSVGWGQRRLALRNQIQ